MALVRAEELAIELKDPVAERGVVRAMSTCYRAQGKLSDAIQVPRCPDTACGWHLPLAHVPALLGALPRQTCAASRRSVWSGA